MRPVMEGFWRQSETFDGTYTFADLLDIHDLIDAKYENERRVEKWAAANEVKA